MDCTIAHPKTGMTRRTMVSRNERSRWKIIQDILKVAFDEKKAKKTRIMHMAHLDWRNFKRYYDYLMEEGLLANCDPENEFYMITDKGKKVLDKLNELDEILKLK